MQELIDALPKSGEAEYLLDTCFIMHMFEKDRYNHLTDFCKAKKVGMSSFNLIELVLKHHLMHGKINHHVRNFLKEKLITNIPVNVSPGEKDREKAYVSEFDPGLLGIVKDPSDAVLLVLGLRIRANILTRDKHHIFTTKAENHLKKYGIRVLNDLPK